MLLAGYFGGSNFAVIFFFKLPIFRKKIDKHFMYLLSELYVNLVRLINGILPDTYIYLLNPLTCKVACSPGGRAIFQSEARRLPNNYLHK